MKRLPAALALILILILAGCTGGGTATGGSGVGGSSRDLEHVPFYSPDFAIGYNNVDGHPNFVIFCIMGEAYLTVTRDWQNHERHAEWDNICPPPIMHKGLTVKR